MVMESSRRRFLTAATGAVAGLSGCSGGDSDDIEDSDGDGVIDSEDYAPSDPSVQEKSDLQQSATQAARTADQPVTARETPTATPSPTATPTPRPTPEPGPDTSDSFSGGRESDSQIQADTWSTLSSGTPLSYNQYHSTVQVRGLEEYNHSRGSVIVALYRYPREELVAYGQSDGFDMPETEQDTQTVDVSISSPDVPTGERLHHLYYLVEPGVELEDITADQLNFLYESDPFRVSADGSIERDHPEHTLESFDRDDVSRTAGEGAYRVTFEGTTNGRSWSLTYFIYKSVHSTAVNRARGRGYDEYVQVSQSTGFADEVASLLYDQVERNGFTDPQMQVELVIDWVQSFPYTPDDVATGYDDYPKFPTETMTDLEGDCEDTSILLAAVVRAEPFGYGTALIQPPGHMMAGVYSDDLPGIYFEKNGRRYYVIETTGEGWGVGDMPDEYQDSRAIVYPV
jgi:hypothetical protein